MIGRLTDKFRENNDHIAIMKTVLADVAIAIRSYAQPGSADTVALNKLADDLQAILRTKDRDGVEEDPFTGMPGRGDHIRNKSSQV